MLIIKHLKILSRHSLREAGEIHENLSHEMEKIIMDGEDVRISGDGLKLKVLF
jgi:hypothetical protein